MQRSRSARHFLLPWLLAAGTHLLLMSEGSAPEEGAASAIVNGQPVSVLIQRYTAWLKSNGAILDKISIEWSQAVGFHLKATRYVEPGETLMHVPARLRLGPEAVQSWPMLHMFGSLSEPDWMRLMLIAENANKSSFWRPYFDMLPQTSDALMFWTDLQLGELQSSESVAVAQRQVQEGRKHLDENGVKGGYLHLKEYVFDKRPDLFPDGHPYTQERYLWATQILRSRTFGKNIITPLIDLANHRPDNRLSLSEREGQGFAYVESNRRLQPGDEIFIFYGFKSDSLLLSQYGFTAAPHIDNPFNKVVLRLSRSQVRPDESKIMELKANLMRAMGLDMGEPIDFHITSGPLPPTLMAYLTVDACESFYDQFPQVNAEAVLRAAAGFALVDMDPEIARWLFRKALRNLMGLVSQLKKKYSTTLKQDNKIMASLRAGKDGHRDGEAGRRKFLALMVRMGEKKILADISRALDQVFPDTLSPCLPISQLINQPIYLSPKCDAIFLLPAQHDEAHERDILIGWPVNAQCILQCIPVSIFVFDCFVHFMGRPG